MSRGATRVVDGRAAWLALALCLVLTTIATAVVSVAEHQVGRARFATAVRAARDRIDERMASYVAMLRGSAGLLSQLEPVREDQFRIFVERLELRTHYPGTQGVGYSHDFGAVSVEEANAHALLQGWKVHIRPATPRDEVHAVVLIEPHERRNLEALGYDGRTEAVRREAMDRARDEGAAALSGPLTLEQEIDEPKQTGMVLFVPVWLGGTTPPTVEERRARLKGFVYAPLRSSDLFHGIFGDGPPMLSFQLFDRGTLVGAFGTPSADDRKEQTEQMTIGGRTWTARFVSTGRAPFPLALDVLALGVLLSFVVFSAIRAREDAVVARLRAEAGAEANRQLVRFTEMFIGVLGHDLRNPLGAIGLAAESIARDHAADSKLARSADRILGSSRRMTRMVDQILDLTRARLGGGLRVTPRETDLRILARDIVDELSVGRPGCELVLQTTGELGGSWDPDRLAQVLSNLVGNALEHSGGAPIRVELDGTEPFRVVVRVHNATTIPPEEVGSLFEPFRQGRDSLRTSRGLGLGLYITRSVVEAHGGTIDVESSPGVGTTFTVVLPRRASHPLFAPA